MKKGKSNFFLIAPFALWGCISVWTSNLVRLTDKSAVPYSKPRQGAAKKSANATRTAMPQAGQQKAQWDFC